MSKKPITMIKIGFAALCVVWLMVDVPAACCWGADKIAAKATITLDVTNEPLRSVLAKITKKTGWKIKVPDRWLDKPVTQTLNKATLEDGLRSVLNNAGVENLLLMYDENVKVVTLFDIDSLQGQAAGRPQAPAQPNAQQPAVSAADSDPMLQRPARVPRPSPARVNRRTRRQIGSDDD